MLQSGKPEHAALPPIWEKPHHGSPAQLSLRVTLARRHPLWDRKTEARSDTGGTLQGGASQTRGSRSSFCDQRSGFFLGGNSRYENAIALRTIHARLSRAGASDTRRLNNGGKRKYAKTIADSTAPTTLTIDPKREDKATSTTTKPRGTSARNCEWENTFATTRAVMRLKRAPVTGRPTATSLVWIDMAAIEHCGGSDAFVCTVPILSLDIVNIADIRWSRAWNTNKDYIKSS